jgi:hypothetical protein
VGALPDDVESFIEHRFDEDDIAIVLKWLDIPELTTPRVMRCVLYLSNGSLSLLRHYIDECVESVGPILLAAEYACGVSDQPMLLRDMSLPFPHRRNLGRYCFGEEPETPDRKPARSPERKADGAAVGNGGSAQYLSGQRFYLGEVMYVVARRQPSGGFVRCYRVDGNSMTPVRLPLMFVLERFAETIELTATPWR